MRGHRPAVPLLLTLAVAGCSASPVAAPTATRELPPPLRSGAPSAPASTVPPAPTSTAPASAASPARGDATAGIPAAARAHTPEGAEAFVRYFVDQINVAWTTPRTGLISSLSLSTCKSCANLEKSAADMAATSSHYAEPTLTLKNVEYGMDELTRQELVTADVTDTPQPYVTKGGSTQLARRKEIAARSFDVAWSRNSWRISEIKVLK
ncbi:DUF6318 family protein [Arsenicicoccus dermatophilus]|uniref:DUF6318 family protein n=1 Tax=Arsenicicoccus dermatophilus TaxID=1076331 RepID=UPI003917087E